MSLRTEVSVTGRKYRCNIEVQDAVAFPNFNWRYKIFYPKICIYISTELGDRWIEKGRKKERKKETKEERKRKKERERKKEGR